MVDEPVTQRITADLRRQIERGTLGPGALLPSEPEVARLYGVSRQTARTAMQALERDGLVVVRPRRGRIVRSTKRLRWHLSEFENPEHTVLSTSDAWESDVESQGHDPSRQDLQVETIAPPPAIAERLGSTPIMTCAWSAGTSGISTTDPRSSRTTSSMSESFGERS